MYRKDNGHPAVGQDPIVIPNGVEIVNAMYVNLPSQGIMDTVYENYPPREHHDSNGDDSRTYSTIDDVQQGH